jgi:hypothetical protein
MNQAELAREIIATYKKHGWQPRRALLRSDSHSQIQSVLEPGLPIIHAPFDAIWFSRSSFNEREAWELRLIEESPYALFETFGPEMPEEERDELRTEMETRILDRISIKPAPEKHRLD